LLASVDLSSSAGFGASAGSSSSVTLSSGLFADSFTSTARISKG